MTARAFGLDDKVSTTGDVMLGTLALLGAPPLTIEQGVIGGTVILDGTSPVSVSTTQADDSTLVLLAVMPGTAPAGIPWVSSITPGAGFTAQSTSGSDTAVSVCWYLVQPA